MLKKISVLFGFVFKVILLFFKKYNFDFNFNFIKNKNKI